MARRARKRPGQPGGIRDLNRKAKAQALLDAALPLLLARGIEGVSVDDITQKAKMAKGSFYRYFTSQKALVDALIAPTRDLMVQTLEACSRALEKASTRDAMFDAYRPVGEMVGTLLLAHPGVVRLYLQELRGPAVGARAPVTELAATISRYAIEITLKAQAHGVLRPIPVPVSALTVVGAAERLLLGILHEEELGNPLLIPEALTSLILDGLKAP
jgi:AcrR family transcriptional regulator